MKTLYTGLSRAIAILALFSLWAIDVEAIVTVTGADGVIYDIYDGTMNVKVSKMNTSLFRGAVTDITIPVQVVDHANTAVTTEPYTVIGFDAGAFKDCSGLRNITIEAPLAEIPTEAFSGCSGIKTVTLPSTIRKINDNAFLNCSGMTTISGYEYLTDIGRSTFSGCLALESISLPEGLTKMGSWAFYKCESLQEVSIPASLTIIEQGDFQECTALKNVTLREGLTSINQSAFSDCPNLVCPTFPSTLTYISSQAFKNGRSLGVVDIPHDISFGNYVFSGADITKLTFSDAGSRLGSNMFEKVTSLKEVTITKGIRFNGSYCFNACPDLEKVTVNEGVTSIYSSTFYESPKLTTLTLPESLDEIGSSAFYNCPLLEDFTFPTTMTSIGQKAFASCKSLQHLVMPAGVNTGDSAFGSTDLLSITYPDAPVGTTIATNTFGSQPYCTKLVLPGGMGRIPNHLFYYFTALESVEIGNGITEIEGTAFYGCSKLKEVILPPSVKTIGTYAFYQCGSLTEIEFPEGLELIKSYAFEGTKLTEVTFPSSLRRIGTDKAGGYIHPGAFRGLPLTKITFKEGCRFLDDCTFENCTSLTEVYLPESMDTINHQVFAGCSALKEIKLPTGLKLVESGAFSSCALESIDLPAGCTFNGASFSSNKQLTQINFPSEPCYFTDSYCFQHCYALREVTFPSFLEEVPQGIFESCNKLEKVNFNEGLKTISNRAFYGCSSLVDLDFPASLDSIGESAFYGAKINALNFKSGVRLGRYAFSNTKLTSINFADEYTQLGFGCFYNNDELTSVDLPCSMKKIENNAFQDCDKLETVTFCPEIEEIGELAFQSCDMLHNVYFPPSIKKIGNQAFESCGTNSDVDFGVVYLNEGVHLGDQCFSGTSVTGIIFNGCATFGKNVLKGVTSIEEIAFPACMDSIPDGFCNGWKNLRKVTIPKTTRRIGSNCFNSCYALTSIELPDSLEEIGSEAFHNAYITEIIFPDRDVKIGNEAFKWTLSTYYQKPTLQRVEFSQYQSAIPYRCFYGCDGLEEVTWRQPTEGTSYPDFTFGNEAFYSCDSLKHIILPDANLKFESGVFRYCYGLQDVVWPSDDKTIVGGNYMFENCTSLRDVAIPAGMKEVPQYAFQDCKNIQTVTIPSTCPTIGMYAFKNAGVYNLNLAEGVTTINSSAFYSCKMSSLCLPATLKTFSTAFEACSELETVNFAPNAQATEISQSAFYKCQKLKTVEIPEGITSINTKAFYQCSMLEDPIFPQTLKYIGQYAYYQCDSIKHLNFPTSMSSLGGYTFAACNGLEDVVNNSAAGLYLGGGSDFSGCSNLKNFLSNGNITQVGTSTFLNCTSLEEFVYNGDTPITQFNYYCFQGCSSLKNADFLQAPTFIGPSAFRDCTSLRSITIPATIKETPTSICYGCTSLQSIIWNYTGKEFSLNASQIADAPLKALSYSWASDILMPNSTSTSFTMKDYVPKSNSEKYTVATDAKLLVPRGERWKYIEKGYGQVFDVIEMRNPSIDLTGDIFSVYDKETETNHYQANLRWHLPLSDLNQNGPTFVDVYRKWKDNEGEHKVKVAEIELSQPSEPHPDPNWVCDEVITVDVKYNGDSHHTFTGDFVGFDDSTNKWRVEYLTQDEVLTFDAKSHKRQLTFDRYGYKSWFALCDTFSSPSLVNGNAPISYTYSAVMKGFEYDILQNNTDLPPGKDELLYHTTTLSPDTIYSNDCVLSAALAVPTLSFTGLYNFSDIEGDLDHSKPLSIDHSSKRGYQIHYHVDTDALMQEGYIAETKRNEFILSDLQLREYKDGKYETIATYSFPTYASGRKTDGVISLTATQLSSIEVGKSYIVVTHSKYRGDFGSAPITIPGIPEFKHIAVNAENAVHSSENENDAPSHWALGVMPIKFTNINSFDLSQIGYTGVPSKDDWFFGIWRRVNTLHPSQAAAFDLRADALAPEELLHHTSGVQTDCFTETLCDACVPSRQVKVNNAGNLEYADVADIPFGAAYSSSYRTRLYVKVPSTYLPHQDGWMIAETEGASEEKTISGVENVNLDPANLDPADVRWFDLQGRPVANPVQGQPYIRVTPAGPSKVTL